MDLIQANREFMKSNFASLSGEPSDQSKGVPGPPLEVAHDPDAREISLPRPDPAILAQPDLLACMKGRRSRRAWTNDALSMEALAFLLWATQGVEEILGDGYATLRTVPSGGARHAFETYLVVSRVTGLTPGVYRYLPLSHDLVRLFDVPNLRDRVLEATFGQRFVVDAPVVFFWSCVPYRGEWRYTIAAHKTMLLDAGHVCQNLYLACEAIGAGACAVAAYDQKAIDALLQLDGQDEFVIYLAPVGKPAHR